MQLETQLELTERIRTVSSQLTGRLRRTIAGKDLTTTETTVLSQAVRNCEVRLSQLAEEQGMNPTMLSRVVNRLEEARLIARRSDPQDGRVVFIEPTQKGRQLVARISRERSQAIASFVDTLDNEERRILDSALPILERLAEHLKDMKS